MKNLFDDSPRAPAVPVAMQCAALALAGAACVPGFAPFGWWALPLLSLAIFAAAMHRSPPRRAALLGYCFGLGLFLAGVSWVYVSLHDFGGMAAPIAIVATLLFCAILALYPALAAYLCAKAHGSLAPFLAFPAAWTLCEWTRSWMLSGFPWLSMGYSQLTESPLRHFAPIAGVFGVTLAMTLVSGALATLAIEFRRTAWSQMLRAPGWWVIGALFATGYASGLHEWTQRADAQALSVSLLQGNISQDLKWQPERLAATLHAYREMTLASRSRLILLPETALPQFDIDLPRGYLDQLAAHARAQDGDLLLGIPEFGADGAYYNSVISIGSEPRQTYRKSHLVPFGDYFPLRPLLGWVMELLHIPMSSFSHGDSNPQPLRVAGQKIAANICYEDAFGEEIIRQLPEASMLANFTNDAWWGRSIASQQHLQMAQMRALETGRYLLRATNTGVTAIIDQRGNVSARAPEFSQVTLNGVAYGYSGATPYVRTGNWAVILLAGALYSLTLAHARRVRSRAQR